MSGKLYLAIVAVALFWWFKEHGNGPKSELAPASSCDPGMLGPGESCPQALISYAPAKASAADLANFSVVPEQPPVTNLPITEAAYHQAPTNYAPAFGAFENQPDSEVITLQ